MKKSYEKPSIGILLCKDKDSEVVEYALSRSLSPTMVAEYTTQLPDKKVLQNKLHELFETFSEER
ncbi:MAG: PDDEXK nuclease domain-containing protein [Candidatus Kapaibacteriota bacterium]